MLVVWIFSDWQILHLVFEHGCMVPSDCWVYWQLGKTKDLIVLMYCFQCKAWQALGISILVANSLFIAGITGYEYQVWHAAYAGIISLERFWDTQCRRTSCQWTHHDTFQPLLGLDDWHRDICYFGCHPKYYSKLELGSSNRNTRMTVHEVLMPAPLYLPWLFTLLLGLFCQLQCPCNYWKWVVRSVFSWCHCDEPQMAHNDHCNDHYYYQ